ncbi:MAG: isoamylase early set domain-containing protein [Candidatus Krumholzibacteria bacterium]|nr:isoamylase early set domain-containing protein [Candidatus Krumholzibacteria bacterium]
MVASWARALACSLPLLALAACGTKAPPPRSMGPEIADGGAVFRYRNADASRVNLVGDFNAWDPTADPMTDENGDGEWTLFYPLAPGRYAYKFVVDGRRWIADPTNPDSEPDGFDGRSSILVVPGPAP